jgi:hypothetical protein
MRSFMLAAAFVLTASCTPGASSSGSNPPDPEPPSAAPAASTPPTAPAPSARPRPDGVEKRDGIADLYTPPPPDLYDPDTIPKFELTFDAAAMAVLTSTNVADNETWVHAHFKHGAITFPDVGVRRKGSQTFRSLPQKAALKVKFNKWVKGQKLYGLKEITLNSMVSDPTCLSERLTYHVFRALGLPAPKANTAELTINGEPYGIYANIETPDEVSSSVSSAQRPARSTS